MQRFLDLPEGSGPAIFSVNTGHSLNPKVLKVTREEISPRPAAV